MQKDTKIALLFCGFFVGLLILSVFLRGNKTTNLPSDDGVAIENGVQVIDIAAKGGFTPSVVQAAAGVPTQLRFTTNGTYDCSSSIIIPSLKYKKFLPATGSEVVALSADQATGTLKGSCSMGMYTFEVVFK